MSSGLPNVTLVPFWEDPFTLFDQSLQLYGLYIILTDHDLK